MSKTKKMIMRTGLWLKAFATPALIGCVAVGCAPRPMWVVSSHTVRVKPDQDVDTVWLFLDDTLIRCNGGTTPPSCTKVQEPQ